MDITMVSIRYLFATTPQLKNLSIVVKTGTTLVSSSYLVFKKYLIAF